MLTNIKTYFMKKQSIEILYKYILSSVFIMLFGLLQVYAQQTITGTVIDEGGMPIPGASVLEKGTNNGAATDFDGDFTLLVSTNAILTISYLGYLTQDITVTNQTMITVTLLQDANELDEVVVVGYGTQKKSTVTGSVAQIKSEEITLTPVANVTNALSGRLPGLISVQSGGVPGRDAAALNIRGFGNALIIVDGIESSFSNIDANQIETISILKDGAGSVYGSRAGNGVILITTKRGKMTKPTITFNTSYTLQGITTMPGMINAGDFASLKNETWIQEGRNPARKPFKNEEVELFYNGTDPQYPNTDWLNVLIKEWAPQTQNNFSVRGGGKKIKFYGFIGHLNQETLWKKDGGEYNRLNLQSNVDAQITEGLSLRLDLNTIIEDKDYTMRDPESSIWPEVWNLEPIYPSELPDPTLIPYTGLGHALPFSSRELSGYNDTDIQELRGTLALNYDFKNVEGLSVKAFINAISKHSENKFFTKPLKYYSYDYASETYTRRGGLGDAATLNQSASKQRTTTQQYSIKYDHTFGDHDLEALVLYELIDYSGSGFGAGRIDFLTPAIDQLFAGNLEGLSNYGSAWELGRASFIGRVNYSYKSKYLIEASLRADASAKFPEGNRWGCFPSVSLGWRVTQEDFMNSNTLTNLKLRASYGSSGLDEIGNFQYLSGYNIEGNYVLGDGVQTGIISTGIANPFLTWEKNEIYNIGVDFGLWNNGLYGEADAFYRLRTGILATRLSSLPSTFGANLPPENLNSLSNRGFEFLIGTKNNNNELTYNISTNISYTRAKWEDVEEPEYIVGSDEERIYEKSGQWADVTFGLQSDGLFTSQDEIDALTFDQDGANNATLRVGDMKYLDTNDDGTLDFKDQVEIGKSTIPNWIFGFSSSFKYKNFDLSLLFQGAFNFYKNINVLHQSTPMYNNRWTEDNNNSNAFVPRKGNDANNYKFSDHFYKKSDYIRLKQLTFGYNIPTNENYKVRLFFAGTNLLTFSGVNEFDLDPEAPNGSFGFYYPQQKTISFGLNLNL